MNESILTELGSRFDERLKLPLQEMAILAATISGAFREARRVDPAGRPTVEAEEDFQWLTARDPRHECFTSFDSMCYAIGYDADLIRRTGLPRGAIGWEHTQGGIDGILQARQMPRRLPTRSLTQRVLNFNESLL